MAERDRYIAREDGVVIQEFGDELLIYDRTRDVAHCLTQPAARVWRACEGRGATLDELTDALTAEDGEPSTRAETAALVTRALTELDEKRLLAEATGGMSRRHVLKIGAVGAGALAAPLVVSAAVPRSAEAFKSPSTCGASGTACTTANTYGTSATNTCCPPGQKSCPAAVGAGTGGCYCNSGGSCANCVATGSKPPGTCGDGTCATKGASNRCCCSGVCSGTSANKCA